MAHRAAHRGSICANASCLAAVCHRSYIFWHGRGVARRCGFSQNLAAMFCCAAHGSAKREKTERVASAYIFGGDQGERARRHGHLPQRFRRIICQAFLPAFYIGGAWGALHGGVLLAPPPHARVLFYRASWRKSSVIARIACAFIIVDLQANGIISLALRHETGRGGAAGREHIQRCAGIEQAMFCGGKTAAGVGRASGCGKALFITAGWRGDQ